MKLRPYHNPDRVDASKVPPGWRFRYADEMVFRPNRCRIFKNDATGFADEEGATGIYGLFTYIVPVS